MVDPLDGTTNFVHRWPFVCVSIGLTIKRKGQVGLNTLPGFACQQNLYAITWAEEGRKKGALLVGVASHAIKASR